MSSPFRLNADVEQDGIGTFVEADSCSTCPAGRSAYSSIPNDDTSCKISAINCGATPCAANSDATENARCCNQATCAQKTDGTIGGSFSCAAVGTILKSNPGNIKCGATPCAANSDAIEKSRCCTRATCAQRTDGSNGGSFSCAVGTRLKSNPGNIVCGATPCAANSDATENARCCNQNVCSCTNGVKATGTACTSHNDHTCTSCSINYYKTSSTCSACLVCGNGKRETSACSTGANRVCTQNTCSCTNGVKATGTACTTDGANICSSCGGGYYLSGTSCVINTCSCQNGVKATGTACTTNGANICSSCVTGYIKDGDDSCTLVNCEAGKYKTGSR
jgi:hypothetical protein